MRVSISDGPLIVEADTLGAELTSVRAGEKEWLWQNGNGQWAGHAPVLFPVCGNCALISGGREYPVGRHGFARKSEFRLIEKKSDSVCFELTSNENTRAKFPYEFIFRVRYRVCGTRLRIVYEIENPSKEELYFSCGGHESFVLDEPLSEYGLRFSRQEKFSALLHDDEGRLTGEMADFGEGTYFPFPEAFLTEGRTVIFGGLQSRKAYLMHRGQIAAAITFRDFENLLLWRAGSEQMICIEPWHNLPDGDKVGEFSKREGVICVPACEKKKLTREIVYRVEWSAADKS